VVIVLCGDQVAGTRTRRFATPAAIGARSGNDPGPKKMRSANRRQTGCRNRAQAPSTSHGERIRSQQDLSNCRLRKRARIAEPS
jgi:hypothetical protein